MRCPFCKVDNDKVVDSRSSGDGDVVRRRRECLACGRRYTTYERVEDSPLRVVKKDGSRVPFEREKILAGLRKACEKRPVSSEQIDDTVRSIEDEINRNYDREVPSSAIGEMVMDRLKKLDSVAYVRFASVYRDFKDPEDFVKVIEGVKS
ncbi:MAG: transcriptional repressor NrdR [Planctomycetaceae bacterium]|nr:Transcriptional repressor NrdR [Planctomycetota bacterium]MCQ3950963.1 transcriptional regulator NrdR [Planctomycetota bacterium]NUO16207.1 transcriptional repressor NrdR [Planctomycetaceae bacterium]GIK53654.1 MAG: transcriptional repressor NrdR [Planctomycetota bacterium]HRJ79299.1 transcriptional regulator NrdR [Planctomycetota bacterium]